MNEQQRYTEAHRNGVLISTEAPRSLLQDPVKLQVILDTWAKSVDSGGRLHPTYSRGKHGRISSSPSLDLVPWECFCAPAGSVILDLGIMAVDAFFIAWFVGQVDLCERLVESRQGPADVLVAQLGLTKRERQDIKYAFYSICYPLLTFRSGVVGCEARERIFQLYPLLRDITPESRVPLSLEVHRAGADFCLGLAEGVIGLGGCRLVGFQGVEPIIECTSDVAEESTRVFTDRGYEALGARL